MAIEQKWERLTSLLQGMGSAVIAYSGGVDSALLLKAAAEVLGPNLIAVTAVSETYPAAELAPAQAFARSLGVTHRIVPTEELASEEFTRNTAERCYFCKQELFAKLRAIADIENIPFVLDGSNTDDLGDYRPGRKAAAEYSVRSPLVEAGISKQDVRDLAHRRGLPMKDKPSLACLASRIPYGTTITLGLLRTVQAAEERLRGFGLSQVRVRHHGDTARIEVQPGEFAVILQDDRAGRIVRFLKELGYTYVCLDLEGYRTGSMNEGIVRNADCGLRKGTGKGRS